MKTLLPNSEIIIDSANLPLPDLSVQHVFYVHTANVLFTTCAMLMGSIPYFYYLGLGASHAGFFVGIIAWSLTLTILSVSLFTRHIFCAIAALGVLCFASAAMAGFTAAITYTIAPVQMLVVSCGQSIAIVIYTRLSPRHLDPLLIGVVTLAASTLVWCISIYAFIIESDWLFAGLIFGAAILLMLYNIWFAMRMTSRFDSKWTSVAEAICTFYCDLCLIFIDWASKKCKPSVDH